MAHRWTPQDDLKALYLYLHGEGDCGTYESLGDTLGMGESALRMRGRNISYVATGTGLSHPSKQTIATYHRHKETPQAELRKLAFG